jgi:hypothetical protein
MTTTMFHAARQHDTPDKGCIALCRQQPSHRILGYRLGSLRRNENNEQRQIVLIASAFNTIALHSSSG